MQIMMKSPLTGNENVRDIPIPDMAAYDAWQRGEGLIQKLMPSLSNEDREFLVSGATPEDWAIMFPPEQYSEVLLKANDPDIAMIYPGVRQDNHRRLYLAAVLKTGIAAKIDAAHNKKYSTPSPYSPVLAVMCPHRGYYHARE